MSTNVHTLDTVSIVNWESWLPKPTHCFFVTIVRPGDDDDDCDEDTCLAFDDAQRIAESRAPPKTKKTRTKCPKELVTIDYASKIEGIGTKKRTIGDKKRCHTLTHISRLCG